MLTTGLEAWIQKGKAEFKTFVVGGSGVGTIPVPKNKFIIIIGFDFFPFIDGLGVGQVLPNIYQFSFNSKKSKNHFVYRNGLGNAPNFVQEILFGAWQKDVYLVHEDNVHIDIVKFPPASTWATTYSPLPAVSQERPTPVEYGQLANGQPAVRKIIFSPTESYEPLTDLRDDIVKSPGYREQFRVDVNDANKLNDITDSDYSFPILDISYVEFNMNLNEFVQASN